MLNSPELDVLPSVVAFEQHRLRLCCATQGTTIVGRHHDDLLKYRNSCVTSRRMPCCTDCRAVSFGVGHVDANSSHACSLRIIPRGCDHVTRIRPPPGHSSSPQNSSTAACYTCYAHIISFLMCWDNSRYPKQQHAKCVVQVRLVSRCCGVFHHVLVVVQLHRIIAREELADTRLG